MFCRLGKKIRKILEGVGNHRLHPPPPAPPPYLYVRALNRYSALVWIQHKISQRWVFIKMTIFLGRLCWLIINKTLAQPLFRGCLYSRDTCLGPDGVQWIEVPVYYELLVLHCTLPMHINFFDSCYFLLTGTSLSVRWKCALRKRYARCGVRLPWRGFWTVDVKFVLNYFRKLTLDDLDWAQMN